MTLSHVSVSNFRNLSDVSIDLHSRFNLFYGVNGSGKTSLLESIYYLSVARSFRSRTSSHIVQKEKNFFSIFAQVEGEPLGIERKRNGDLRIKKSGEFVNSVSALSEILPIQLIYPDSYELLNGGSQVRRRFLDWGVFHVKHKDFFFPWKNMQRILKQRNALLKQGRSNRKLIQAWDFELVRIAKQINPLREAYIEKFEEFIFPLLEILLPNKTIRLKFKAGWDTSLALEEVLEKELEGDLKYGHTRCGPHRADIEVYSDKMLAKNVLSRGEQKMLVCAMSLAQAKILRADDKTTIFLIDDLPSELDIEKRKIFCDILADLNTQVFITGIEKKDLKTLFHNEVIKMFHVEQGNVVEDTFD